VSPVSTGPISAGPITATPISAPISAAMIARSGVVAEARWSPDGQRLGWVQARAGSAEVVVAPADDRP
jgi:hypothetical protein